MKKGMKATQPVMEKTKFGVQEDVYNNKKDKFKNDEYVEYVPVNMHGRPVGVSAKEKIAHRNKQLGN